ncbi:hydrogenase maturation protease [Pirellulaceae bacterium SH449]
MESCNKNQVPVGLVYGIGSPNGDDQAGWKVIEKLQSRLPRGWQAKSGLVPLDLLNHLEGVEHLYVIDACEASDPAGTLHNWNWPTEEIASVPLSTSHDFSLSMTLELSSTLGLLPKDVKVWGVVGKNFCPGDSFSLSDQDLVNVVEFIEQTIRDRV